MSPSQLYQRRFRPDNTLEDSLTFAITSVCANRLWGIPIMIKFLLT